MTHLPLLLDHGEKQLNLLLLLVWAIKFQSSFTVST